MVTREQIEALENVWNEAVGLYPWLYSPKALSKLIAEFLQEHVPHKSFSQSEVADAVRRFAKRSSHQTGFSILVDFLCGASASGSGSQQRRQDAWMVPFDDPFLDPGNLITSYVLQKLDSCVHDFYMSGKYYAPFVPIVQSSGWGKSKLMKHMASQGIVVFYFCLLDKLSSGYPRADPEIANVFASIKTEENAYAIFRACLEWLHEQDGVPDKDQLFYQQQSGQWPEALKQKIIERNQCSKQEMQKAFDDVWTKLADPRTGVQILFVVDEARQLLQQGDTSTEDVQEMPFTLFRRASSDFTCPLKAKSGALVVVIDTFGKVSNLAPRKVHDPSGRVAIGGRHLFTPISAFPSFNVLTTPQQVSTLEQASVPLTLFSRGRPLWAATLLLDKDETDDTKVKNLLQLARSKLMGGSNGKFFEDPKSSLVVLGRRIAVDVCPQDQVAEELVASHMQVCLHTSASREFILTTVLPEPVLAQAAASLLHPPGIVAQQLHHLNSCMLKGLVSAGERGELVARFLLLNTMDEVNGKHVIMHQSLEVFLRKLTKNKWPGFGRAAAHLKGAQVFFNAFYSYFGRNPSYETLREFLRNAGALICRQGQRAYDLYIPFVTPNEKGAYDLSDENVHCLGVQVKNRKEMTSSRDILQNMSNYAFSLTLSGDGVAPTIFLVLQLGENESDGQCLCIENANQISIALEGLNAIHYHANWKESLVSLLRERPDPKTVLQSYGATQLDLEAVGHILKQLYDPVDLVQPAGPAVSGDASTRKKGKQVVSAGKGKQSISGETVLGEASTPSTRNKRKQTTSGNTSTPVTPEKGKQAGRGGKRRRKH